MEPTTLYQDDVLMVIAKPAGWITNLASTTKDQPVVERWLATNFKFEIFDYRFLRHGIVHRLDKETSGALIVAKTAIAFENLQAQFKDRQVKKTYLALVHGRLKLASGEISLPVGRLPWRRDRFGVLLGGRAAITEYHVVKNYKTYYTKVKEALTLLKLKPRTGRTHQIRIHMKHIGHPVVADNFYAGRKTARQDRLWCLRLFLHAAEIEFSHPTSGKQMSFSVNLPEDLQQTLTKLSELKS